jgi:hypothetical protein
MFMRAQVEIKGGRRHPMRSGSDLRASVAAFSRISPTRPLRRQQLSTQREQVRERTGYLESLGVLGDPPVAHFGEAKDALENQERMLAERAFDRFIATHQAKYPRAVQCLVRDRTALLAFYDFPAEHWLHIRTTNPIESSFATVRLRTDKTKNCVSAKTGLALVHQLAMSAQKRWRKLRGFRQLADVVAGVKFIDGVDERKISRKAAA